MIMLTEKSIIDVIKGFFSNVQARFTKMREKRAERKEAAENAKEEELEIEKTYEVTDSEPNPVIEDFQSAEPEKAEPEPMEIETNEWTENVEELPEEGEEVMALTEVENESYRLPSLQLLASPVSLHNSKRNLKFNPQ